MSAAVGMSWRLGEWDMDSSLAYGSNEMEFTIKNTLNRSLGPTSKTTFDAGGFDYDQLVMNVSGVRTRGGRARLAAEHRDRRRSAARRLPASTPASRIRIAMAA